MTASNSNSRPMPALSQVLAFPEEEAMGRALATALNLPLALIERHRFPDGELRLRLPAKLKGTVVLLRSLHQPNEKLVELLISAPAARALGARRVLLACPYLAYMRQDIEFNPGEAVSQRHIAGLLGRTFDGVVTIDPHLHRISSLEEVMPGCASRSFSAAGLIGRWVYTRARARAEADRLLLLGPDEESGQWVRNAAVTAMTPSGTEGDAHEDGSSATATLPHAWCLKERRGDRDVEVTLPPDLDLKGRAVVLIDDMASTGRTLMAAAKLCQAGGAASIDVAVTHALFVGDAMEQLHAAGIRHVWSTDCVAHESNALTVVPMMADALRDIVEMT